MTMKQERTQRERKKPWTNCHELRPLCCWNPPKG